jgi:hypothetical protein
MISRLVLREGAILPALEAPRDSAGVRTSKASELRWEWEIAWETTSKKNVILRATGGCQRQTWLNRESRQDASQTHPPERS